MLYFNVMTKNIIVMSMYSFWMFMYLHCASWHSSATLTEVFPCFFLSCKANTKVKPVRAHYFLLALPLPRSNPTRYKYPTHIHPLTYFIDLPMKMEPIVSSETSAIRTQTPGNYPKRNKLQMYHIIYQYTDYVIKENLFRGVIYYLCSVINHDRATRPTYQL